MNRNEQLFAGKPNPFGGVSNEKELVKLCPEKFKKEWVNNEWTKLAERIFFSGFKNLPDFKKLPWKNTDEKICKKQGMVFYCLLRGWGLKHEHKIAVAGWMLSEMFSEVPKY